MIEVINKVVPDRKGYCRECFGKPFRLDQKGFTDEDKTFLKKLGEQISLWVFNQLLPEQWKAVNTKMETLATVMANVVQMKTPRELAYLVLRAATHQDGLDNSRAFLLLPPLEEGKEYDIYAIGAKNTNEAETIWKRKTDYKILLEEFKNHGIPDNILWNTRDFRINAADLTQSFILKETREAEH